MTMMITSFSAPSSYSSSSQFGLSPTSRITEVDGVPTLDLDAFLKAVANKRDGESVR